MLSCFWANKIDFVNFLSQFSMIGYTAQFYNKTANIVIFLLFSWALSYIRTITRSHGIGVTSVVRETPQVNGRRQSYPSHCTHTPKNRHHTGHHYDVRFWCDRGEVAVSVAGAQYEWQRGATTIFNMSKTVVAGSWWKEIAVRFWGVAL